MTEEKIKELKLFHKYVEIMKKSLIQYKQKFCGKRFSILLANGEKIQLVFNVHIIAHFLGLQYGYLAQHPLFETLSAYDSLRYIIENKQDVVEEIINGTLSVKEMFSQEFERKNLSIERTPILDKNILNDIVFVCPYNKRLHNDENKKPVCSDYLVGIRNTENDMTIIGIVKDQDNSRFYINSNLLVPNSINYFKELREFIAYQTLTYANFAKIYNYNIETDEPDLVYLTEEDKLQKIKMLQYYQEKLQIKIDTTAEAERQLNELIKQKQFKKDTLDFLELMKQKIIAKEEISLEDCKELDQKQHEVILLVNQLIQQMNILKPFADTVLEAGREYTKKRDDIIDYKFK